MARRRCASRRCAPRAARAELPSRAVEQRVGEHGALEIARGGASGVVETWTNGDAGSEQAWRFGSRPAGEGDLVVEVRASGLAYRGVTATGLHFANRAGLGFRYGHATWVDAAGERVEVAARYERGVIALRVPREVVDGAAYPVLRRQLPSSKHLLADGRTCSREPILVPEEPVAN